MPISLCSAQKRTWNVREENLAISEDRLERIREDRRVGSATELSVLNAEVNYNADEIELSAARVESAKMRFGIFFT